MFVIMSQQCSQRNNAANIIHGKGEMKIKAKWLCVMIQQKLLFHMGNSIRVGEEGEYMTAKVEE